MDVVLNSYKESLHLSTTEITKQSLPAPQEPSACPFRIMTLFLLPGGDHLSILLKYHTFILPVLKFCMTGITYYVFLAFSSPFVPEPYIF